MASAFSGVPLPKAGELSLYVVGSGFGESCVVVLPTGNVVVVDACTEGKVNHTLDLLDELKITTISLFVLTHSDLDHIRGGSQILDRRTVDQAWRFPGAGDLRVLAAKWLRSIPDDERLLALDELMRKLDELAERNDCTDACAETRSWPSPASPSRITCLAPSSHDRRRVQAKLDGLVRYDGTALRMADAVEDFFARRTRKVGSLPNILSLATAVDWKAADVRILLGGDVENGDGSLSSGWKGILASLEKRDKLTPPHMRDGCALVRRLRSVKVAHHGSRGAAEEDAWATHVRAKPDTTWAVIAPFDHGKVLLPDIEVLQLLRTHRVRLAVTDYIRVADRVKATKWKVDSSVDEVCPGPVVALRWKKNGVCVATRGKRARVYRA